jgi:flagellar FliL protein
MSKDKTAQNDEDAPTGGTKKLLMIVAVVLVAAAAAGYFFLWPSAEAGAATPEHGGYVALQPIAVNLAGGGYLKVGIALEITAEAASGGGHGGASVDGAKAYDQIISTFSQAQPADVIGARDALKEALEKKIIEAYTDDHGVQMVMGIYYTDYVTQ